MFQGAAEDMAHSSLRFGLGRFTTEAEVDFVVQRIVAVVNRLREMSFNIDIYRKFKDGEAIHRIDRSTIMRDQLDGCSPGSGIQ